MPSSDFVPKFGQIVRWQNTPESPGDDMLILDRINRHKCRVLFLAFRGEPDLHGEIGLMTGMATSGAMEGYTLLLDVPE